MATAYENLLANARLNNMLTTDDVMRQSDYWKRFLSSVATPTATPVAQAPSGDGYIETTPVREADPFWDYHDYWKEDGISGRNVAQAAGMLLGLPTTPFADYAMGQNPAGDIGSYLGSGLLTQFAGSIPEAIALSNVGAIGGEIAGKEVGEHLGYTGQWFDINQPGSSMAKALGFEAGTQGFDRIVDITQDYISEKEAEGLSRDAIKDEVLNFGDQLILEAQPYGPVEVEDRSLMPGEQMAVDNRGIIEAYEAAAEPTTVSDFAGMFTGIGDSISNWFDNIAISAPDTTNELNGLVFRDSNYDWNADNDYTGRTETGQIDWTQYGDTDEGEEEAQSFNDSSHNWN